MVAKTGYNVRSDIAQALYKRGGMRCREPALDGIPGGLAAVNVVAVLLTDKSDCLNAISILSRIPCTDPCVYVVALAKAYGECNEEVVGEAIVQVQRDPVQVDWAQVYNFDIGNDSGEEAARFVDLSTALAHPIYSLCTMWRPRELWLSQKLEDRLQAYIASIAGEFGTATRTY